jgi:hypothetical protein
MTGQMTDMMIRDFGEENTTLKQHYISLMDQLEIDGIPKTKISTIGKQIIIEKKRQRLHAKGIRPEEVAVGSWWYDVAREKGCIDPHYSHSETTQEKEKQLVQFETENRDWINLIDGYRDFMHGIKDILKRQSFDSMIPEKEKKDTKFILSKSLIRAQDRTNLKQKIAPAHYSVLFRDAVAMSASAVSTLFYLHVRKREEFTAKQAGKILKLTVKDIPGKYEPQNQDESESLGFSGEPCPNCHGYRTEVTLRVEESKVYRQLKCYKCDNAFDAPKLKSIHSEISEADW